MKAVVQRVSRAAVSVDGTVIGSVDAGFLVLAGVAPGDGPADAEALAAKIAGLRVFPDEEGRMNRSVLDAGGGALVVSQFTLYGDVRKGRRPSFTGAAPPEVAEPLVEELARRLAAHGVPVATGRFGARMQVELVNDGPVTLLIESRDGSIL